jgi:hypothetical protein
MPGRKYGYKAELCTTSARSGTDCTRAGKRNSRSTVTIGIRFSMSSSQKSRCREGSLLRAQATPLTSGTLLSSVEFAFDARGFLGHCRSAGAFLSVKSLVCLSLRRCPSFWGCESLESMEGAGDCTGGWEAQHVERECDMWRERRRWRRGIERD